MGPVSSHVFSPDRIIGHPPYSWSFAPSRSWSWVTVRQTASSPTGTISQVTRELPSAFTSSLHSAVSVWTRRRGGSASSTSPSPSGPPAAGAPISIREPGCQSEITAAPKLYLARISGSVIACQTCSGLVRM